MKNTDSYTVLTGCDPRDYTNRRVAVAMSGGVDSSLSAILLKEAGFDVVGLTMHLWDYDRSGGKTNERGCCDLTTFEDARRAAFQAGIPHYTIDLREEFERTVVNDFIEEYLAGRTPNPCVRCNTLIKWEALRRKATALNCGLIATGHYARIARHSDGTFSLLKGMDPSKDQSYFLWGLDSRKLADTLFPLGTMTKDETRRKAAELGLATASRRESQEICFIPDDDYRRFLRERFPSGLPPQLNEGTIYTVEGTPAGEHSGSAFYTIGQRKGLGIALGRPVYVTSVDTGQNTVTVGDEEHLLNDRMTVGSVLWTRGFPPADEFAATVKIRYRHPGSPALVKPAGNNSASVIFDTPQRAITPGQSAVFYYGDLVIGGGVIGASSYSDVTSSF